MIGAGTIINPILKIVTTVAILAAVYFFILKPILDTGEEISGNISNSFPSLGGLDEQIRDSIENTQGAEGHRRGHSEVGESGAKARRLLAGRGWQR